MSDLFPWHSGLALGLVSLVFLPGSALAEAAASTAAVGGGVQPNVVITDPGNVVWPRAQEIPLFDEAGVFRGNAGQSLVRLDESRWYKFRIQPGSRVIVTLTDLPANYDLVLFKDIARAYNELTSVEDLPRLDAEFADDAFSPAQFSPAQFSPAQFSPAAFSPAQFSPAQFSPAQFSPAQFSPAQFSPAQFSPDAYAPAQFSPAQFSPAQFSPAQFSPAQFSPALVPPGLFDESAYAGAQTRSVIAVSAFDGTAAEGVVANTWNEDGNFYVRVRGRQGAYDSEASYRLDVFLYPGLCQPVTPIPVDGTGTPLPPSTFAAPAGGFRTLILTDLDRLVGAGPSEDRTTLLNRLSDLAVRPEVNGHLVDVKDDAWVAFFAAQAEANPQCPYAKNLLAEAIRSIVLRSRIGNALEYLVLLGGDSVIPYFRHPDEAMLGPEEDYIPPVLEFSASQASLRQNLFLSQDRYGARCEITRKHARLPVPELAVGRLLEHSGEIVGMLDAYLATPNGVLPPPSSALVSGYDFLTDAAEAVAAELHASTTLPPERLIAPAEMAPTDPDTWTAQDLREAYLGRRHDLAFLAGHFNASAALAADYVTRFNAREILESPLNLANAILYSPGCHSGYNVIDGDAVPGVTQEPDWAQTCARKQMILIAGTGYQYGDTDFIEYSERLYLDFTRNLRTGPGPISLGKALVRAKQQYLTSTADLRGIHEKSVLQATLFGLPMTSLDLPGARLPLPGEASIVTSTQGYAAVDPDPPTPGEVLGLRFAEVTVEAALTRRDLVLNNAERDPADPTDPATVNAVWFEGSQGVVANPAEPVLPLELRNVDVPGLALRGIGFRGGEYVDLADVTPLTGAATTEIRGVHPAFLSDTFFPTKFWRANYFGEICDTGASGTRLVVTPAQARAYPGQNLGVIRRYPRMDFRLFYSANVATYLDPTTGDPSTPALSAPPSISNVRAWKDGDQVRVEATVVGNPAAGIQAVWITYTALRGPLAGRWTSLDLTQGTLEEDTRLWRGSLALGSTESDDLRFLVQAVNGVGLVALNANVGAYFTPGATEFPPGPPADSRVELLSPPASGFYGTRVSLQARLTTTSGSPLSGRLLSFKVGGLESRNLTGADGIASVRVNLLHDPGALTLRASYSGAADFGPAQDETTFGLDKSPTSLDLSPAAAVVSPGASATLMARLTDSIGRPIPEQTVIFVVSGPGGTSVTTAITDFSGQAELGPAPLVTGTYSVETYFGQPVSPPPPFPTVGGFHRVYQPATTAGTVTVDPSVPSAAADVVIGRAGLPLKIAKASLLANDTDPEGGPLTLDLVDATTIRATPISNGGAWLLIPSLSATSKTDTFRYRVRDPEGKTATGKVTIRIEPDEEPTSNLLGATPEGAALRLRFAGIPGRTYRIQYSPGLTAPVWTTIGSATVGPDGTAGFLAPILGGTGFYRTVHP